WSIRRISVRARSTNSNGWSASIRTGRGPRCRETDVDFLHCRRRARTFDCSLSVLPPCRALAEERVHAFLAVVREEVAGNGMSSHTVGIAERQIELTVEELLA